LERQIDHGAYIELAIGPAELGSPGFIGHVSDALARFGAKPLLVVCDDRDGGGESRQRGALVPRAGGRKGLARRRLKFQLTQTGRARTHAEQAR
jgi:hypothetical protein